MKIWKIASDENLITEQEMDRIEASFPSDTTTENEGILEKEGDIDPLTVRQQLEPFKAEIIQQFLQGSIIRSISGKYNVIDFYIKEILKGSLGTRKYNYVRNKNLKRFHQEITNIKFSDDEMRYMSQMFLQGIPTYKIAKKFNVNRMTIMRKIKEYLGDKKYSAAIYSRMDRFLRSKKKAKKARLRIRRNEIKDAGPTILRLFREHNSVWTIAKIIKWNPSPDNISIIRDFLSQNMSIEEINTIEEEISIKAKQKFNHIVNKDEHKAFKDHKRLRDELYDPVVEAYYDQKKSTEEIAIQFGLELFVLVKFLSDVEKDPLMRGVVQRRQSPKIDMAEKVVEALSQSWYKIASEVPQECTNGDCYEVSGRYMMDQWLLGNRNLWLVHGDVTGQGKIQGVKYDHAWVEDGDECIDKSCGRDIRMPKAVYYALGHIENTKRYSYIDMSRMINEYKHWGPW